MRRGVELGTLALAVLVGYGLAAVFSGTIQPSPTPGPGAGSGPAATSTTSIVATTATSLPLAKTYLVWSTGGLTPDVADGLRSRFDDVSVVKGDAVELDIGDGSVIPLDGLAMNLEEHRKFDPEGSLTALRPGAVVLGETSAQFRGLGEGDRLTIAEGSFEIVGSAPDSVVGAAEVVFDASDPGSPVTTDRYALVSTDIPRQEFEEIVRSLYDGPAPIRIRSEGETPWLRHGDAVLPQIFIKLALGEFSYRDRSDQDFVQDRDWVNSHIATETVPILGRITCHEVIIEMLDAAMTQVVVEGLGYLVDPSGFAGCWNPRYIKTVTGSISGLSRHAWGGAADINATTNPAGSGGDQDPRLVALMLNHGFTWGGDWLVPDPMHFEYGVPPG